MIHRPALHVCTPDRDNRHLEERPLNRLCTAGSCVHKVPLGSSLSQRAQCGVRGAKVDLCGDPQRNPGLLVGRGTSPRAVLPNLCPKVAKA